MIKSENDPKGHGTQNWQCPNNELMMEAIFCMVMSGPNQEKQGSFQYWLKKALF